jgi:phosphopentomutase
VRVLLIVLDGVGIGELPDAGDYGDRGAHTLRHVAEAVSGLALPNLERLGLGRVAPVPGVRALAAPEGAGGVMRERSAGKDSTTGHWEMAGIVLERPFPVYPSGFPADLLARIDARIGRGWIGNVAASGTEIIQRLGEEHQRTGRLIVYTSADSVFQIAAHEATVPLAELYRACEVARRMLSGEHAVGRVIARPFAGGPGAYVRTANRRDFSLAPPQGTVLDLLAERGRTVVTVGKVDELFAGRGVTEAVRTRDNAEGEQALVDLARRGGEGLVFANLGDFDTKYGHRNDPTGFARALEQFDSRLGEIRAHLRSDEVLIVTADHGNDPTTPGTDHTREHVPLLVAGPRVRAGADLGVRATFADVGATVADLLGAAPPAAGTSFLREVRG